MAHAYDPQAVETRWQERWQEARAFEASSSTEKPKRYVLDMFPYPSGAGLHLGHVENYAISDVYARYARHQGFNVLHPMGWDAFGLPAEQYAIKHQVHPKVAVERNVATFKRQMMRLGCSYDWSRELSTTDEDYYRWTQWIFLKLHEQGLAFQADVPVNWCEALGTVLANEEVVDGKSEVGGHPVVRRPMRQWLLKITAYADRLLDDLETLDWPEHVKQMQREWIGRSVGAEVTFAIGEAQTFTVFTTRPDTLYGATFCVLAPEHPLVETITTDAQREEVDAYVARSARRSERDRVADVKTKTGVFTGAFATNPVNGEPVPVWISDYVLLTYGTGAVMAVPGHDERDHAFARQFGLEIREVITGGNVEEAAWAGDGTLVNSDILDGLDVEAAKARVIEHLESLGAGRARVQYRLRDWLFSRQRYWGEPFPVVMDAEGQAHVLPAEALPVTLPDVASYKPTGTGESPLAGIEDWVNTTLPGTDTPGRRETNTMPQWAGSCWYYLRFIDPKNDQAFVDAELEKYWMPVDMYIGGVEHAVLHLLYARFWHKVLYDCGLVSTTEPFQRLVNQGMVLAPSFREAQGEGPYYRPDEIEDRDGTPVHKETGTPVFSVIEKMSKSKLNVANPDELVARYGADTLRCYILFMGPPEADKIWDDTGIEGLWRFLGRIWRLVHGTERHAAPPRSKAPSEGETRRALHTAIAGVTADMDAMAYNTAISKLMILVNHLQGLETLPSDVIEPLLIMLAPFAPHMAEELWAETGATSFASHAPWPAHDPAALVADTVELAVQVNGKVRGRLTVATGAGDAEVLEAAKALEGVQPHLTDKRVVKEMVVKGRLVVLVAK